MRKIWNKGHRIRASDKHLVYHFSIGTLLFVFVAVLLLLNIKQLMCTDWEHFSLLENDLTLSPYNFITILIAPGACVLVAYFHNLMVFYLVLQQGFFSKAGTIKRTGVCKPSGNRYGSFLRNDFCHCIRYCTCTVLLCPDL